MKQLLYYVLGGEFLLILISDTYTVYTQIDPKLFHEDNFNFPMCSLTSFSLVFTIFRSLLTFPSRYLENFPFLDFVPIDTWIRRVSSTIYQKFR